MVDLGPALDAAHSVVADALATMGTQVTQTRPQPANTVNADTGALTPPIAQVLAVGIPAIVVPAAAGGQGRVYPGSPVAEEPRVSILLPPDLTDIRRGDNFTVTTSRDPRLTGHAFEVTAVEGNTAGAARQVTATPVLTGGQP